MRFTFDPRWEALEPDQQLNAIGEQIQRIAADGAYPTGALYNKVRPDWMPTYNAIRNKLACDWTALVAGLGVPPTEAHIMRKNTETECQCGKPIEALRTAVVMIGGNCAVTTAMPLCRECAEVWDSELS